MDRYEYGYLYVLVVITNEPPSSEAFVVATGHDTRAQPANTRLEVMNQLGAQGWLLEPGTYTSSVDPAPSWLSNLVKPADNGNAIIRLSGIHFMRRRVPDGPAD